MGRQRVLNLANEHGLGRDWRRLLRPTKEILRLLALGVTHREIARRTGAALCTISRLRQARGTRIRQGRGRPAVPDIGPLRAAGLSAEEIALQVGAGVSTVRRVAAQAGRTRVSPRSRAHSAAVKRRARQLLRNQPPGEVARRLGVSSSTVRVWATRWGLTIGRTTVEKIGGQKLPPRGHSHRTR